MSPYRALAIILTLSAVTLTSMAVFLGPPTYREAAILLHLAGNGAPIWSPGIVEAASLENYGAGTVGFMEAMERMSLSGPAAPIWVGASWTMHAVFGNLLAQRLLCTAAVAAAAVTLWGVFCRIGPDRNDRIWLLALFLLMPGIHAAGSLAGPEAFAVLGLAVGLSAASTAFRENRLGAGRALMLGGGAGLAAASSPVAAAGALVLLATGLAAVRTPERGAAARAALAAALPPTALAACALWLPGDAPAGLLSSDPRGPATPDVTLTLIERAIAVSPNGESLPVALRVLLIVLAASAPTARLVESMLENRPLRWEFTVSGLALAASLGTAVAIDDTAETTLAPLAVFVAVLIGMGALSLRTKILAAPLIAAYGLAAFMPALADRGDPHWRLTQRIASISDFRGLLVIDRAPGAPPSALPFQMAFGLPGAQRILIGDAGDILTTRQEELESFTFVQIVHERAAEGSGRLAAFRERFPAGLQRLVDRSRYYDVLQLHQDRHRRGEGDSGTPAP